MRIHTMLTLGKEMNALDKRKQLRLVTEKTKDKPPIDDKSIVGNATNKHGVSNDSN